MYLILELYNYKIIYCLKMFNERLYKKEYYLKKKYNLSIDEWINMIRDQEYKCLICDEVFVIPDNNRVAAKAPCVDKNHETNEVRGILCLSCKLLIGSIENKFNLIPKTLKYLKLNDSKIIELSND